MPDVGPLRVVQVWMEPFLECCLEHMGRMGPQGLTGLMWALAALDYVPPPHWLRALAGQVGARAGRRACT